MNQSLSAAIAAPMSSGLVVPIGFSAPEIPLNALVDENNQPVVDENGNYILTS